MRVMYERRYPDHHHYHYLLFLHNNHDNCSVVLCLPTVFDESKTRGNEGRREEESCLNRDILSLESLFVFQVSFFLSHEMIPLCFLSFTSSSGCVHKKTLSLFPATMQLSCKFNSVNFTSFKYTFVGQTETLQRETKEISYAFNTVLQYKHKERSFVSFFAMILVLLTPVFCGDVSGSVSLSLSLFL